MKRALIPAATAAVLLVSCVTVNIYFPAEEVKQAAASIVDDIYADAAEPAGEAAKPVDTPAEAPRPSADPISRAPSVPTMAAALFRPALAYAEQNIEISTPKIQSLREGLKAQWHQIRPYVEQGRIGIGSDGFLKPRDSAGLAPEDAAALAALLERGNQQRQELYREIAAANGFPGREEEVRKIFAKKWISRAPAGWWVQRKDGSWYKK